MSLNLEPADNRAATSPKTLGACTENRLCTSARNTRRRGPDYYFGGGGSLRLGRRLHHAVIATASIFSSFGPLTKCTMQFRRIRSQAWRRASSFEAKGSADRIAVQSTIEIMRGPIHAMLRCPLGFHSDVPVKNQIRPSRSTFMKERREAFNQSYGIIDARPVSIRGSPRQ